MHMKFVADCKHMKKKQKNFLSALSLFQERFPLLKAMRFEVYHQLGTCNRILVLCYILVNSINLSTVNKKLGIISLYKYSPDVTGIISFSRLIQ